MTETTVREVFFNYCSGGDLNEALVASVGEIMLEIIREGVEQPEPLPEIIGAITVGKSHITLFARMTAGTNFVVPASYLAYFDQIPKAMMDVVIYTRDNFEIMDPWFRERFTKECLEMISVDVASSIEESTKRPANVRAFHSGELEIYDQFFNMALIGIIGPEKFQKYVEEYNKCAVVLRQCQIECRAFGDNNGNGTIN